MSLFEDPSAPSSSAIRNSPITSCGSLGQYTSDILDLVEEGNRVCGKLRFHGIHQKPLFGRPATGQHVWWHGTPIFIFRDGKIEDLWVLGDIYGLIGRLDEKHGGAATP
ncbi:ester cyclase [Bradyrhizobium sp. 5.13L]